jgi:hypothetical protein
MRTQRPADCPRVNLKRVFHHNGARPDAVHQFVFGDKFAGGSDQNFEELEGAPTNRYGRSTNAKFALCEVYLTLV